MHKPINIPFITISIISKIYGNLAKIAFLDVQPKLHVADF
jgi:hypothetical protein